MAPVLAPGTGFHGQNYLNHQTPLPAWWLELDATDIRSAMHRSGVGRSPHQRLDPPHQPPHGVRSFALQRGFNPRELNDWFVDVFVDGTPWVMPANVIGMSQYADGGQGCHQALHLRRGIPEDHDQLLRLVRIQALSPEGTQRVR